MSISQPDRRNIQTWVSSDTAEQLALRAREADRSVAAEVRHLLREHLRADHTQKHAPARGGIRP